MVFDKTATATVVSHKGGSFLSFKKGFEEAYPELQNEHLIIDLIAVSEVNLDAILYFKTLSSTHRSRHKSFVVVADQVHFDELPDTLMVTPTITEAKDILDMEEIERDLGL
ncbi:MAG: ribonuclease Z [Bacteroidota bacterium]